MKLINNKFLLYSTENYIQYLATNHIMEKNEKYLYIYIQRERDRTGITLLYSRMTQDYKSIIQ